MPRAPKEKIEVPPEKTETEIEDMSLDLYSNSLEKQAQEQLTPQMIKVLKKIAYYTSKVGLTLPESCALVDINYEKFQEDIQRFPIIGKVIKMKELEYKKDLMYTISQKAKSGDDKLAQWLLERRYPEEFAISKKGASTDDEDIFAMAFAMIRRKGDSTLINPGAGKAVVVSRPHGMNEPLVVKDAKVADTHTRIANILNG